MSDKEEFEKWFQGEQGKPYYGMYMFALAAWQARQPEIDALMAENERLKAAPTPPAQEDEPVASLYVSRFRGYLENTQFEYLGDLPDGTYKLYTRPDNSGLRKAAEEALKLLDKLGSGPTIEKLRVALEGN